MAQRAAPLRRLAGMGELVQALRVPHLGDGRRRALEKEKAVTEIELQRRAWRLAEQAHRGQVRKYTGEPYIEHPRAVARIIAETPHTTAMICAAYLHDTIEDTDVTFEDIAYYVSFEVAVMVMWLTSPKSKETRKVRKAVDAERLSRAPADVQSIKVADLTDNTKSITAHDKKFAAVYLVEKEALLDVLLESNLVLWVKAYAQLKSEQNRLLTA